MENFLEGWRMWPKAVSTFFFWKVLVLWSATITLESHFVNKLSNKHSKLEVCLPWALCEIIWSTCLFLSDLVIVKRFATMWSYFLRLVISTFSWPFPIRKKETTNCNCMASKIRSFHRWVPCQGKWAQTCRDIFFFFSCDLQIQIFKFIKHVLWSWYSTYWIDRELSTLPFPSRWLKLPAFLAHLKYHYFHACIQYLQLLTVLNLWAGKVIV